MLRVLSTVLVALYMSTSVSFLAAEACGPFLAIAPVPAAKILLIPVKGTVHGVKTSMPIRPVLPVKDTTSKPARSVAGVRDRVDYGAYEKSLERRIQSAWIRPRIRRFNPVGAIFKILRSGEIRDVRVVLSSGNPSVDRAAITALNIAQTEPLPSGSPEYVFAKFVFGNQNRTDCCCGAEDCNCPGAAACGKTQLF